MIFKDMIVLFKLIIQETCERYFDGYDLKLKIYFLNDNINFASLTL